MGWLYQNPDTGTEWSENHPVESGEVSDALDIRQATEENTMEVLREAWEINRDHNETIDTLRSQLTAAVARADKAEGEVARLRAALNNTDAAAIALICLYDGLSEKDAATCWEEGSGYASPCWREEIIKDADYILKVLRKAASALKDTAG